MEKQKDRITDSLQHLAQKDHRMTHMTPLTLCEDAFCTIHFSTQEFLKLFLLERFTVYKLNAHIATECNIYCILH